MAGDSAFNPDSRETVGTIIIDDHEYNLYLSEGIYADGIISSFNAELKVKKMGNIEACKRVIEMPVGVAQGNRSYGGLCILNEDSKKTYIKVCSDEMLGRFVIEPFLYENKAGQYFPDLNDLARFVAKNCYGG
jgi:hypothetical protein